MLRLPAALLEDISLRTGQLNTLSQTCTTLWRLLNQPETQLRFYLAAQRRNRTNTSRQLSTALRTPSSSRCYTCRNTSTAGNCSSSCGCPAGAGEEWSGFGPATVFGMLGCKAPDADCSLRLLQLMLACANMIQLVPPEHQQAVQQLLASTNPAAVQEAAQLLLAVLPFSEHCLLPFCAATGHLQLVKLLLPLSSAPVRLHCVLHYVKTSTFLAAAAGGHAGVLSDLLSCGGARWACQLSGVSLTVMALDLAALGGHMQVLQLLGQYVRNPSPHFLTAAADSGSGPTMEWALQYWFKQFSAVTPWCRAHLVQMHEALRVACQRGHTSALRQLLLALERTHSPDCCVLALSYCSSTANPDAIRCVVENPQLTAQLARGGPKLLSKLVQAVASCLRIAIRIHNRPSLDLLLKALASSSSSSPLAAARPLLGPQMPSVFDQAAASGNATALQLLLLMLPEHYEGLTVSALEAALSEGHADVAATIKTLLVMQGGGLNPLNPADPQGLTAAAALSPEGNPGLARASLQGAFKSAAVRGDVTALSGLLHQGPSGPEDNVQLLLLRLAAGAGQEGAVRLMLGEFGGGGPRLEANLRAVCRGAVHAGQLALLQSLSADAPSVLLSHIRSQPDALAEYLRAALICGQVDVAAWLVCVCDHHHQLGLVRSTLISLLATSRWELINAGRGSSSHDTVFELLRTLAAHTTTATAAASSLPGTRTGSNSTQEQQVQLTALPAGPPAATAGGQGRGGGGGGGRAPTAAAAGSTDTGLEAEVTGRGNQPGHAHSSHGSSSSSASGQLRSRLGEQLLQPELLGLLLHTSQGNPAMLCTVVELVHAWGLGPQQCQKQQQQRDVKQTAPGPATASPVATDTAAAGSQRHDALQAAELQSQPDNGSNSSSGRSSDASEAAAMSSSSMMAKCNSSSSSSSSNSSGSSIQAASGSRPSCPKGAAAADLLPACSLECGSLQSEDGHAAAAAWLAGNEGGDNKHADTATTSGSQATAGTAAGHNNNQLQQYEVASAAPGSSNWQQLTGQVAQLQMSSSPDHQHRCGGQQHHHHDVHHNQQHDVHHRHHHQQQQQHADGHRFRRESSPGFCTAVPPCSSAVAAARALRPTASQPLTHRHSSPVHPYMQQYHEQFRQLQQQQQASQALGSPPGSGRADGQGTALLHQQILPTAAG